MYEISLRKSLIKEDISSVAMVKNFLKRYLKEVFTLEEIFCIWP